LLSFFRAAVELKRVQLNSPSLIYAIEEPETSQHPIQQRMLMDAFHELVDDQCQIIVTTHNPALANLAPVEGIRYVHVKDGMTTVSKGEGIFRIVANDLGVLPDHRVKVLVCVEGPNDCNFFNHISRLLHRRDPAIPSLSEDPRIAFFHLGGSTLVQWVNKHYLSELNRPEIHLYDRGTDQPPKFQVAAEAVCARGDGSYAVLTGKRELENYLHSDAIREALNVEIEFGDQDNVPELAGKALYNNALERSCPWDELTDEKKGKKISHVKSRLNEDVPLRMTLERLQERDPEAELETWLRRIGAICA
jgi:putative ATP-dependent endonuclease of the OLD family